MSSRLPRKRLVVAGVCSGVGKTTIASGLCRALVRRGHVVQPFKAGPDFIDPCYLSVAAGRTCRNLDEFMHGPETMQELFAYGSQGASIAVVEGVMGLFDGLSLPDGEDLATTARLAKMLGAAVVLVVDASSIGGSVAALARGYRDHDPELRFLGVVLNRVSSPSHESQLKRALGQVGIRCLGGVPRTEIVKVPSRHLGLVPVAERRKEAESWVEAAAAMVETYLDVDVLVAGSECDPRNGSSSPWDPEAAVAATGPTRCTRAYCSGSDAGRPVVAVAGGPCFSFGYPENVELLAAAGAEVVVFDPASDGVLPEGTAGIYIPGGFPETFAEALEANASMRRALAAAARAGMPMLGECGGFMYLGRRLGGKEMCGVLPFEFEMAESPVLGYRYAEVANASLLGERGNQLRGHVFHYSRPRYVGGAGADPARGTDVGAPGGTSVAENKSALPRVPAVFVASPTRGDRVPDGAVAYNTVGTYLHLNWASAPGLAVRFVHEASHFGVIQREDGSLSYRGEGRSMRTSGAAP